LISEFGLETIMAKSESVIFICWRASSMFMMVQRGEREVEDEQLLVGDVQSSTRFV
jgi:hypothetical protein